MSMGEENSTRQEEVRDAAVELFFARGYNGTSMKDIANALNIRAPSLYNHVVSKQEILQAIMFNDIELIQREFDRAVASATGVRDKVRRGAEAHVRHHVLCSREAKINHNEIAALEEPARHELKKKRRAYGQTWLEMVEEAIELGVASCPSAQLATFAILDMGIGVARWFKPDGAYSANTLPIYYGDFALRILNADASDPGAAGTGVEANSEAQPVNDRGSIWQ